MKIEFTDINSSGTDIKTTIQVDTSTCKYMKILFLLLLISSVHYCKDRFQTH